MRISVEKYLSHSSVLMGFIQGVVFYNILPIDIKLFYPLLLANIFLVLAWKPIILPKLVVLFLLFLIVHGLVMALFLWTNPTYPISQIIGISLCFIYFIQIVNRINPIQLFELYTKYALFFAVVALLLFPFGLIDKTPFVRLDGVMSEPSKFGLITVPALIYFIQGKKILESIVVGVAVLLAQSAVGYFGVLIGLFLLIFGYGNLKLSLVTIGLAIIAIPILTSNEKVKERTDSILENVDNLSKNKINNDTNISAFVLLKSALVAKENFINHPLGTGIGTFAHWHDHYTAEFDLPNYADPSKTNLLYYNREDANSLGIRIISDFGLFGILFLFSVLVYSLLVLTKKTDPRIKAINICILVYVFVKILRMGHYFTEEMYFFIGILFIINSKKMNRLHGTT